MGFDIVDEAVKDNTDPFHLPAIADDGQGMQGASDGTGLSIVRALVRDELGGSLELSGEAGLCVDVRFPA